MSDEMKYLPNFGIFAEIVITISFVTELRARKSSLGSVNKCKWRATLHILENRAFPTKWYQLDVYIKRAIEIMSKLYTLHCTTMTEETSEETNEKFGTIMIQAKNGNEEKHIQSNYSSLYTHFAMDDSFREHCTFSSAKIQVCKQ